MSTSQTRPGEAAVLAGLRLLARRAWLARATVQPTELQSS